MKHIILDSKVKRPPYVAAFLSLLLPGLGQVFTFRRVKGYVLLLVISFLILLPLAAGAKGFNQLLCIQVALLLIVLFWGYSILSAAGAVKNSIMTYRPAGSIASLLLFAVVALALLFFSLSAVHRNYGVFAATGDIAYPSARSGELLLTVKKRYATRGDLIVHNGKALRVVALGKADIRLSSGRLLYGFSPFPLEEFSAKHGDERDIYLERNMDQLYQIHLDIEDPNLKKGDAFFSLKSDQMLLVSDNRNYPDAEVVSRGRYASIDGVILSSDVYRVFPYVIKLKSLIVSIIGKYKN